MNESLRTLLKVIIAFVIIGILINDGAAYLYTMYKGQDMADQVAQSYALEYNSSGSAGNALAEAQRTAQNLGVSIAAYRLLEKSIEITIQLPIQKTVIISRVKALEKFSKVEVTATADLK